MTASSRARAPWKWTALMLGHTWNAKPAMSDPQRHHRRERRNPQSPHDRGLRQAGRGGRRRDRRSAPLHRRSCAIPMQRRAQKTDCLTPVQVEAARHIYAGAKKSDGTVLMPGQVRGSELGWLAQMAGRRPAAAAGSSGSEAVFQDPDFKNVDFDFDRDTERALEDQGAAIQALPRFMTRSWTSTASRRAAASSSSSRAGPIR